MSIVVSSPEQICNAPYNNSTAKMQFSFSKDKRFRYNKENINCPYYDIPHQLLNRTTTFGYGTKYDFTKDMPKSPPPTAYGIKSEFEQISSFKKGFGFGNSRENMVITGPLAETINNKNPGPGAYEIPNTRSRCFYSLKGKRKQPQAYNTPGPGNYQIPATLNKTGHNFFSKYRNHQGRKFTSSTQRFKKSCSEFPGPGNYDSKTIQLNSQGRYVLSKLHNSKVRSFGNASRKSLNQRNQTPGPGNYRLPSDFGYYVNKTFYMKSRDSTKKNKTLNTNNSIKTNIIIN